MDEQTVRAGGRLPAREFLALTGWGFCGSFGIAALFVRDSENAKPATVRVYPPGNGVAFPNCALRSSPAAASDAAEAAFARVSQLNSVLSDYDSDSELSRLSRTSGSNQDVPV